MNDGNNQGPHPSVYLTLTHPRAVWAGRDIFIYNSELGVLQDAPRNEDTGKLYQLDMTRVTHNNEFVLEGRYKTRSVFRLLNCTGGISNGEQKLSARTTDMPHDPGDFFKLFQNLHKAAISNNVPSYGMPSSGYAAAPPGLPMSTGPYDQVRDYRSPYPTLPGDPSASSFDMSNMATTLPEASSSTRTARATDSRRTQQPRHRDRVTHHSSSGSSGKHKDDKYDRHRKGKDRDYGQGF